jgi:hypothetical protein
VLSEKKQTSKNRSRFIQRLTNWKTIRLYLASWTATQSLTKNAASFWLAATRCLYAIEVQSSRGGRSEAQHNAPRQGSALPWTACQIIITLCQRHTNAALS